MILIINATFQEVVILKTAAILLRVNYFLLVDLHLNNFDYELKEFSLIRILIGIV